MKRLPLVSLLAALAACAAPRVAYNRNADFSKVKRVAVVTFGGKQGDVAADALAQSLLALGADVVERNQLNALLRERHLAASGVLSQATVKQVGGLLGVDALFMGNVGQNSPAQSYVVTNARRNRRTTVTPVGGRTVVPEGPVLGVPDSQVVTTEANVSIIARMVDVRTGSLLWSASMDDQSFDSQTAMQDIADALAKSLGSVWPTPPAKK